MLVRTWQQALVIKQPDTRLAVSTGVLLPGLEAQVKGSYTPAESRHRNDCLDQRDGEGQSALGYSLLAALAGLQAGRMSRNRVATLWLDRPCT